MITTYDLSNKLNKCQDRLSVIKSLVLLSYFNITNRNSLTLISNNEKTLYIIEGLFLYFNDVHDDDVLVSEEAAEVYDKLVLDEHIQDEEQHIPGEVQHIPVWYKLEL